jgi:hypothetical protein
VTLYLGRPGNLLALPSPARGMGRTSTVAVVDHVLLGGGHRTDRMGLPRRSIKLSWNWLSESDYATLDDLFSGSYGPGALAMLDPAEVNYLPVNAATGTTQTQDTIGYNATVGTISSVTSALSLRGRAVQWVVPASASLVADLNIGSTIADLIPIRPGVVYTGAVVAWLASSTGFTAACELEWYDSSGAVIGSAVQGSSVALTTSAQRLTVTSVSPSTAAYAQVTLTNAALTSGSLTVLADRWMLRDTPDDGTWTVGPRALRVAMLTLDPSLQLQSPGSRHDVSCELQEVG